MLRSGADDFRPIFWPRPCGSVLADYALLMAIAPWVTEALTAPVSPAGLPVLADVAETAPVMKKARKSAKASGNENALDKNPRRRSPKNKTARAK